MTRDELLGRYAAGERNFSGADLSGADLSGADLSGADLSEADLSGADLSEADLRAANLRAADLRAADLRAANLYGADLSEADLSEADLRAANLRAANLRAADLRGADLSDCRGVYSARAPFMSSRNDALYAGVFKRDGALELLFAVGCQKDITADELRARVAKTHGDNAHATQYMAAITFIEACYASDLATGRFAPHEEQATGPVVKDQA